MSMTMTGYWKTSATNHGEPERAGLMSMERSHGKKSVVTLLEYTWFDIKPVEIAGSHMKTASCV